MQSIRVTLILLFVFAWDLTAGSPLDDYVNTPDPVFSWQRLQTYPQPTYTLYVLNMTSQQWFDGETRRSLFLDANTSSCSVILLPVHLVALSDNHRAEKPSTTENCLLAHRWWR